jgi:hypothetical protein
MNYVYETDSAIAELLQFKISHSVTNNQYLFNNRLVNEIGEDYYENAVNNIKMLLHKALKNGTNHSEYLQSKLDIIWKHIEYIERYKCYSPEFFDLYSNKIRPVTINENTTFSNTDLYEKYKEDSEQISATENDMFAFLNFHSENLNQYKTQLDFHKGLLLYAIDKYREIVKDLYYFLYSIHMNVEFTDFKNLDFEIFVKSNKTAKPKRLFHFNLDKKSIAHLFKVLIEEDILVFDGTNDYMNTLTMKKFVEDHFTYLNNKNQKVVIKNFNREYAEANSLQDNEINKQEEVLNYLIGILEKRKAYLKK